MKVRDPRCFSAPAHPTATAASPSRSPSPPPQVTLTRTGTFSLRFQADGIEKSTGGRGRREQWEQRARWCRQGEGQGTGARTSLWVFLCFCTCFSISGSKSLLSASPKPLGLSSSEPLTLCSRLTVHLCLGGLWVGNPKEWLAWWLGSELQRPPGTGIWEGCPWLATSSHETNKVWVPVL